MMQVPEPLKIPPVLILSTGRCGSTAVSEMLNKHPDILSLSEFFVPLGSHAYAWSHPDGKRMWKTYSQQCPALHSMLKDGHVVDEGLYPYEKPGSRFKARDMPPILAVTLPHITSEFEALYDELTGIVPRLPRMPLADHYRYLFQYLANRFDRKVWIERSGGSLMHAAKLLHLFPEARVIHVHRDGRDAAISMSNHYNFQVVISAINKLRKWGYDPAKDFLSPKGSLPKVMIEDLVFSLLNVPKMLKSELTLADFGAFWNELILVGHESMKNLPAARFHCVRFEDVLQSPRETMGNLIRFIDPSLANEAWLTQVASMIRPTRSKFTTLPAEVRATVTKACTPGLELLGYKI